MTTRQARLNLLTTALDHWIESLPPADCYCILAHQDMDGPVTIADPDCPHHGDTTP